MTPPPVVEDAKLALRAVDALERELRRRLEGETPDPFFDPYVDQLADAGEELEEIRRG